MGRVAVGRSRVWAVIAAISAVAVAVAACTGQSAGTDPSGAASGGPTSPGAGTAGDSSGPPAPTASGAPTSTPAVGEIGGSACGTPHGPYDQPAAAPSGTVTIGIAKLPTTLNPGTVAGRSAANTEPRYLMDGPGLFYYNGDSELINNDSFGTCTLDSLDPLQVTYHINDGVHWSDGVPVSAADILLDWAAGSGQYPGFDAANPGAERITDFPEISDDGQSLTVTYRSYFADYPIALRVGVPAHVVAMRALGEDDPQRATAELVELLRAGSTGGASDAQTSALKDVADFFNSGFVADKLPDDQRRYVSNGAYLLTGWTKGQYITFEANPDYDWGPPPQVSTIVWSKAPNARAAVDSLAAGDVDIINPRATTDVTARLDKLAGRGIRSLVIDGAGYEHLDLVAVGGGPFDPATYGGDTDKALAVRRAFLHTIPRQQILDKLVVPLNPDAVLRNSFMLAPGQPGYDEMIAHNGSDAYADAGSADAIAQAKKLLADAGIATPITVRLLYSADDPRRAAEYRLIAKSAGRAGFEVIDGASDDWLSLLDRTSTYDASLYALRAHTTGVSQIVPNYLCQTGEVKRWGQNNVGHYCNPEVNAALLDAAGERDADAQFDDLLTADRHLWADGFGTVLFQHPDVVGYRSETVTGVSDAPLAPTFIWNYWQWRLANDAATPDG